MWETFSAYYRPTEEEFGELFKDCIFVLDANVLLNLYQYPEDARDDLLKILEAVSHRLWIPHQAALEYQERRLEVIAQQLKRYGQVKDVLQKIQGQLVADLGKLQLEKRHSLIKPDRLVSKVEAIFTEFGNELDRLEQAQPDVFDDDELRDRIDSLLKSKVGSPPDSQDELDEIYQEGESRYQQKRPPGYMDEGKEGAYFYGSLAFQRKYGDLILWKQIIKEAQARSEFDKIIFVTDDDKEDWWWIVESKGEKRIGPRPELVEEISFEADVSSFYMYNSERFMEFAEKHLGVEIRDESIDQVRDVTALSRKAVEIRGARMVEFYRVAEQAVLEWLQAAHPHDELIENRLGFPDFILLSHKDLAKTGYEVKALRELRHIPMVLRDVPYRAYYELSEGRLAAFHLIVVVDEESDTERITEILERYDIPDGVMIKVVTLTTDAEGRLVVNPTYQAP